MVEVTSVRFYAIIGPMNVHPHPEPYRTAWVMNWTRELVGESTPGYKTPGDTNRYYLTEKYSNG